MSETPKPLCEGDCNPFGTPCGAKFCTYEAMQEHAHRCQVVAPEASGPAALAPRACARVNCSRRGIPTRVGVCPACATNTAVLPRNPVADALSSASQARPCAPCEESNALLEAVHTVLDGGSASEFMASCATVRLAMDLRRRVEAQARELETLCAALQKVRAHTSYLPSASRDLLGGLLAGIERITDAALKGPK